ncbi:hypothetical protein GCM10007036_21410 [Alsobacter metallidurans]|uniref:Tyr recombinase domain-containing protein n=1 Tax=Alsobacter metallidurans TaxID=340221 RepID=A0A917I7P5_9HYPH|nr:tyrosine-type recombinase/integrase [Alsobacter metallidurans]GGH18919.1 hypothetical protein GCM10007036_21410 [Alsobacter metallidurans]
MSKRILGLKLREWPGQHQAAWQRACGEDDLGSAGGEGALWRPSTRRKTIKGWGYFLRWLSSTGAEVDRAPGRLVHPKLVVAYITDLRTKKKADYTVLCRVQELYDACRVLDPDQNWNWLRDIRARVRRRPKPVRNKLARLRSARELEELGWSLIRAAENDSSTPLQRATSFRDGLCVVLLVRRLLRLRNLAGLTLGHFTHDGSVMGLQFPGAEMKSKRDRHFALPDDLAEAVTLYLSRHRPVLLSVDSRKVPMPTNRIWISRQGEPMNEVPLHYRIRKRTKDAFGAEIPPHWFRDAGATAIAVDSPGNVRDVATVLGNNDAVAEKHYNQARAIQSARKYQNVLESLFSV